MLTSHAALQASKATLQAASLHAPHLIAIKSYLPFLIATRYKSIYLIKQIRFFIIYTRKQIFLVICQGEYMNKFFKYLILFLTVAVTFLYTSTQSFAAEYMPMRMNSINNHAIGVYFASQEIKIYTAPDERSELKEVIKWDKLNIDALPQGLSSAEIFLAFVPDKKYALLSVMSENDNEDWVEVLYNKKTGEKGWVKLQGPDSFKTWLEFIQAYGKENMLYFLADIPEKYKQMYTNPDETSQTIQDNSFVSVQELEPTYISGNWMLVRAIDYNKTAQIGWIQWRDSDGNTFVFPKLGSD